MYKIEYLATAVDDMREIVGYINTRLCNPIAAGRLAEKFVAAAEELSDFPYRSRVYSPARPLSREYRKVLVGNYLMFYWIDEDLKIVTIARVIYAGRNYENEL